MRIDVTLSAPATQGLSTGGTLGLMYEGLGVNTVALMIRIVKGLYKGSIM